MTVAIAGLVWAAGSSSSSAGTPAQDVESAASVFLSEGRDFSQEAAREALSSLVDSASRIAVDAGLPVTARERLAVAAAAWAAGGFLEPEAVATVHRAYEAVAGGRSFVFPPDVGSIEEAKEYGRGQIARALEALDAGRSKQAVQEVLGFVLLVTTPREKPE